MIFIEINITQQLMSIFEHERLIKEYLISSGKNGVGEMNGSEKTPRGKHIIRAKIGGGAPFNTVFVERRPTGEVFSPELAAQYPTRDWILTRILWLSGTEVGKNRLGNVDTMRRCIYIHGTPDHVAMGRPGSRGCIRMRNRDIVQLFDQVTAGTPVIINE